jgi:hypothetical protein
MNKNSFVFDLKTISVSDNDKKIAFKWLHSKFNTDDKLLFGYAYRVFYKSSVIDPIKIIIPISIEDDSYICFEILDMFPELRAHLFDMICDNEEKLIRVIDEKLFKSITQNRLIRKSVKKLKMDNIKNVNRIKYSDLLTILKLPIIRSDRVKQIA